MRALQTFSAMAFVAMVFLVLLYTTLHLEMTSRPTAEDLLRHLTHHVHHRNVQTSTIKQETATSRPRSAYNVSVSGDLRKAIPHNNAYWNRLLYFALERLDKGQNPFIHGSPQLQCREMNYELLRTNMHDISTYPPLFLDFVQGMNCRSPSILIDQPDKCIPAGSEGDANIFLLFAIKSTPANFDRRQAVRDTWGREAMSVSGLLVRTVFLLGSSPPDDPDLNLLLLFEANQYGDILQWDFHDSFLNLSLKMNMFLQWTLRSCPQTLFVFSGDDDVFVNTPVLLNYLKSLGPSEASHLYTGQVIKSAMPHREPRSKYYIPMSFYDGPYPAYAGGGGFLYSGSLLQQIYMVSRVLPFYPIDDVFTGMCLNALGVSPQMHSGFLTFDVKEKDRENLCVHKNNILIHQRSPKEMKRLWDGIHSPLLTC